MSMTPHGDALVQLTRLPRLFPVNCYLVREDDGWTLIDAALPGSAPAILAAAQSLGAPIVRIALTHAHGDHVDVLDALHAALPAAAVLVPAREARFLVGDLRLDPDEPQVKLRGSWQVCSTRPTCLLHPGDCVGSLEVIAAPDHTSGHVAFLDRRDGTLIAGMPSRRAVASRFLACCACSFPSRRSRPGTSRTPWKARTLCLRVLHGLLHPAWLIGVERS